MIIRNVTLLVGLLAVNFLLAISAAENQAITDKDISVVSFEELRYPALALQTRTEGVVVVLVKLDNDGKVVQASPISGSSLLIPDCLANANKWRFRPNSEGAAVIVYNFRLQSAKKCKAATPSFTLLRPNFANITACPMTIQP